MGMRKRNRQVDCGCVSGQECKQGRVGEMEVVVWIWK